ncbi:hypothetical protein FJY90_02360 [Candidatus Gottesmanbacteria bacterium]|nr:hypothetical protein [Candidatus Gottesmanbacteria bacterium]
MIRDLVTGGSLVLGFLLGFFVSLYFAKKDRTVDRPIWLTWGGIVPAVVALGILFLVIFLVRQGKLSELPFWTALGLWLLFYIVGPFFGAMALGASLIVAEYGPSRIKPIAFVKKVLRLGK